MRILWCTHSMAGFKAETGGYNGCGWITSLLEEFKNISNVEIGVTFYYHEQAKSITKDGVSYFPIYQHHIGTLGKIKTFFGDYSAWKNEEYHHLAKLKNVVDEFKPDIIHVWGTETDMGLIALETDIPVIIHLQGLLNPYYNSLLPPGFSRWNYICKDGYSPVKMMNNLGSLFYWKYKAEREKRVFSACKNYFGRTGWDKLICHLYSPQSNYYYCSEILRNEFYTEECWTKPLDSVFRIVSTISPPLYKGMDMVLKTAQILKESGKLEFEWYIIGIEHSYYVEKKIGIKANDVNVKFLGVKCASEIKQIELNSSMYFHPSYIDNSPNSVCEAQILGLPVIAVNAGGVSSLIEDGNGLLIPSNEPHVAAELIIRVLTDQLYINNTSIESIRNRHSKDSVIKDLLTTYNRIK